jgi:predicted RNA binding protein YcfA (HicA-like mRNA interferase family)
MQKQVLNYRIIIEPEKQGTRTVYNAYCDTLGLADYGDSIEEALKNIKSLIKFHIERLLEDGLEAKDLVKALLKIGFVKDHQTGSHVYLKHPDGRLTSISIHPGTIPLGTMRAIMKQIKISAEELKKLL